MESSQPPNHLTIEPPLRTTLIVGGVWMIVLAAFLLLCGLCTALLYLIVPLTAQARGNQVDTNVVLGAVAGFGALFGIAFLWQGVGTLMERGRFSVARVFPPLLVFGILFFVALLFGLGALAIREVVRGAQGEAITAYVFPPWHVIAASIPPLAMLGYAAHRLGATSGVRALLVALGWGAIGATAASLVVEVMIAAVLIIAAVVAISMMPNSQAFVEHLRALLDQALRTGDLNALAKSMNDPAVLAAALVGVVYTAVLVPFVEEALKALIVAFIDPRRTRLADALLWGIGAGAGFALFENLLNTGTAQNEWALTVLVRIGAAVMHVANGATMGRGWYAARVERRWSKLFIAYGVCVVFHAAWNAAALWWSGSAVYFESNQSAAIQTSLPAAGLVAAASVVLLVLAALGWVRIVSAVRSAQKGLSQLTAERSE